MILPVDTNYLQTSPSSGSYFFLILTKLSKYTCKSPSNKSLFLHKAPFCKIHTPSPLLFHQENTTEKYQVSNYNGNIYVRVQLCVLLFHCSDSWFWEMQFGVIYLETWGSTQPYVAFSTLVACSCFFVFGRSHTAPNFLTLHDPVSFVFWVKCF